MPLQHAMVSMLAWSISCKCDAVTSALLYIGVARDLPVMDCVTPLLLAVGTDNLPVVEELVRGGVSVEAPSWSCGLSPLFFARSVPMVWRLVSKGAKGDIVSEQGVSVAMGALAWAVASDDESILALLVKHFTVPVLDVPTPAQQRAHDPRWPSVMEAAIVGGSPRLVDMALRCGFARPPERPSDEQIAAWRTCPAVRVMTISERPQIGTCLNKVFVSYG